ADRGGPGPPDRGDLALQRPPATGGGAPGGAPAGADGTGLAMPVASLSSRGHRAAATLSAELPRLIASPVATSLAAHVARFGPTPACDLDDLITRVTDAGLRGRGGAAFPTRTPPPAPPPSPPPPSP